MLMGARYVNLPTVDFVNRVWLWIGMVKVIVRFIYGYGFAQRLGGRKEEFESLEFLFLIV